MSRPITRLLAAALVAAPLAASAHVGADAAAHHGFAAGFLHPFTGLDHLAAMLAVGLWSALAAPREAGRAALAGAPLAFAGMLLVGALLAAAGWQAPLVEPLIAASLVAFGLLVATRLQLPVWAGAALAAGFALFHGAAHGQELIGAAALAGMVLATASLHLGGIGLGLALRDRNVWAPRLAGLGVAAFGASLLVG
jgi:urease accessory protein